MKFTTRALIGLPLACGLAASLILLIDYTTASQVCGVAGGCDEVRRSALASVAGVPKPALGVVFFAGVLVLSLLRPRRELMWVSLAGAAVAAFLLAAQGVVIGAWCRYCVIVDASAIALAAAVWIGWRSDRPAVAGRGFALQVAAAAAAVFALLWLTRPVDVSHEALFHAAPTEQASDSGVATIVEFVDFQCPACRAMHARLEEVLAEYGDRVRVVRKNLPLARHEHALAAARAYCCAEQQGAAEEMADRLFTNRDLRPEKCADAAEELGLDREVFQSCVDSAETTERLAAERLEAERLGVVSLPTLFIGGKRFVGVPAAEDLRRAVEGVPN